MPYQISNHLPLRRKVAFFTQHGGELGDEIRCVIDVV